MASFNHGVYFTTVSMLIVEPTLHHNCNRILLTFDVFSEDMYKYILLHLKSNNSLVLLFFKRLDTNNSQ